MWRRGGGPLDVIEEQQSFSAGVLLVVGVVATGCAWPLAWPALPSGGSGVLLALLLGPAGGYAD